MINNTFSHFAFSHTRSVGLKISNEIWKNVFWNTNYYIWTYIIFEQMIVSLSVVRSMSTVQTLWPFWTKWDIYWPYPGIFSTIFSITKNLRLAAVRKTRQNYDILKSDFGDFDKIIVKYITEWWQKVYSCGISAELQNVLYQLSWRLLEKLWSSNFIKVIQNMLYNVLK